MRLPSFGRIMHKSTSEVGDVRDASELPNTATCTKKRSDEWRYSKWESVHANTRPWDIKIALCLTAPPCRQISSAKRPLVHSLASTSDRTCFWARKRNRGLSYDRTDPHISTKLEATFSKFQEYTNKVMRYDLYLFDCREPLRRRTQHGHALVAVLN